MRILHSIEIINVSYLLSFAITAINYFRLQWLRHENNIHFNIDRFNISATFLRVVHQGFNIIQL